MAIARADHLPRHPRGHQPIRAAGRLQRLPVGRGPGRGGQPRGRRLRRRDRFAPSAQLAGRAETIELGRLANENPPRLKTHDRFGNRVDEVEFHPAWHELMDMHVSSGLHALPWREPEPGAHVARAAAFMCLSQAEAGTGCPISMTYSVIPALRAQPEVAAEWEPRFSSLDYDRRMVPVDGEGRGALRDGDDREAGRLRRAREHHDRRAAERRRRRSRVRADRPQVVLLGADVRRLPRPRPGRGRHLLLPPPPLHPRRRAQPLPHPAAQGQARQPLQRLQRGRVPRRLGPDDRRRGPWRPDDHRDGQPHPPRLHAPAPPRGCAPGSPRRSGTPSTARLSASSSRSSR